MKSILCYGDSNTYGSMPGQPGTRYTHENRWPGVLREIMGPEWMTIEEGLPGRTTGSDDPIEGAHLNGRTYLRPCLESHRPIDLIIIMLGTNDLKVRFHKTASEISLGIAALVREIQEDAFRSMAETPEIIIISPPPILKDLRGWDAMFEGGYEKSQKLAHEFAQVAEAQGVGFLDAGDHATCSPMDGFHINSDSAKTLGAAIAAQLQSRWF